MLISPGAAGCDVDPGVAPIPWRGWERDALHALLSPGDSVLELPAGAPSLLVSVAAWAGWITVVEEDAERLSALRQQAGVCGWPNITLTPRLAEAGTFRPFDVVVAPWLNSEVPNVRWLTSLAERRVILHGPLRDAELDALRTSAQALGLDVKLERTTLDDGSWRAVVWLDLGLHLGGHL